MKEPPVRPEPNFPEFPGDRTEEDRLFIDLATLFGCFMLGCLFLFPLFKLISPTKQDWTIVAFLMTSFAVAFTWFLLIKVLVKLNIK